MNPFEKWEKYHIKDQNDLKQMFNLFKQDKPVMAGGDTETNGLHIIHNQAFLVVFGWITKGVEGGRVFTFYPSDPNMEVFFELAKQVEYFFWWNTKFDLHMLTNIGYGEEVQSLNNYAEGMALARLTLESKPAREGGDSLKLKDIGKNYVYSKANEHEVFIKEEKEKLEKSRVNVLAAALKQFPIEGETTATGKQKYWGKGAIEKFLKNPTNDLEDLPLEVREVWEDWQEEYPPVTYADIDRDMMIDYAANDVIIMMEFVKKAWGVLLFKEQLKVFQMENDTILPLYRMERVGMRVDRNYLEQARQRVKAYIINLRNEMYSLIGDEIDCNQHDAIKKVFKDKFNIHLESSDKPALQKVIKNFDGDIKRYAQLITLLRTYEKWYSTYILRVLNLSKTDGRAYTQIHQCSAVSGRVGSDFQQFPKKALKDEQGNELYHPRKAFTVTGGGYDAIYYLDFSQIELRVQSHYTLKVSGGDLNLCRAYMPFKCTHKATREVFDPYNTKHLREWNNGLWIDENGEEWKPTDVHGATTKQAFPELDPESEEFKEMRGNGKLVNFLKNYGGSLGAILSQLDDVDIDTAKKLDEGYYKAFPQVLVYQKMVQKVHAQKGYVQNIFGRRYYIKNNREAYKLANYLVQGTCADELKSKIREIDAFLLPYKSRFQMNIHDELSFEIYKGEEFLVPKLKKIMETCEWINVPVVSDVEVTYTSWADKKEVKTEERAA